MLFRYVWAKVIKKLQGSAVKNSVIHKTSKIEAGCHIVDSMFDKHSFCGYNCEIVNTEVGSFCSIASNVIIGGSQHPIDWVSTSPVFQNGRNSIKKKYAEFNVQPTLKTIVGHDVWIGNNVLIKQGITIGTGAIIGMGSVVTKDVDPYTIVAGNPARVIRKRFSDGIADSLLKSQWWLLDDVVLTKKAINIREPETFLKGDIES